MNNSLKFKIFIAEKNKTHTCNFPENYAFSQENTSRSASKIKTYDILEEISKRRGFYVISNRGTFNLDYWQQMFSGDLFSEFW